MEEQDLILLRQSFTRLIPLMDVAVKIFLERLALIVPSLQEVLIREAANPDTDFSKTLAHLVEALSMPNRMARLARRVGRRCVEAGVTPDHFPAIGEALFWTIRQVEIEHSERVSQAWRRAYGVFVIHMEEGAGSPVKAVVDDMGQLSDAPSGTR